MMILLLLLLLNNMKSTKFRSLLDHLTTAYLIPSFIQGGLTHNCQQRYLWIFLCFLLSTIGVPGKVFEYFAIIDIRVYVFNTNRCSSSRSVCLSEVLMATCSHCPIWGQMRICHEKDHVETKSSICSRTRRRRSSSITTIMMIITERG